METALKYYAEFHLINANISQKQLLVDITQNPRTNWVWLGQFNNWDNRFFYENGNRVYNMGVYHKIMTFVESDDWIRWNDKDSLVRGCLFLFLFFCLFVLSFASFKSSFPYWFFFCFDHFTKYLFQMRLSSTITRCISSFDKSIKICWNHKFHSKIFWVGFRGILANMMDFDFFVSKFDLQSRYYAHF